MSEEQLKELQEYNLEYLEARASEEMFGGDFTSAVELKQAKKEIERLNKIRQQVIDELFELKDMIYKPETREINFDVQRKISSMIVKLGSDK